MSKSILTRKPSSRRHYITKEGTYLGELKEEHHTRRAKGEQKPRRDEKTKKGSKALNGPNPGIIVSRKSEIERPPITPRTRSLDWCECSAQPNRQCDACALLGTRQTDLHQERLYLERMDYIASNDTNYALSARWDSNDLQVPSDARFETCAAPFNYRDGNLPNPQYNIWIQMQDLLASSDEIFPSATHGYDHHDVAGGQSIPDFDEIMLGRKR